MPKLLQYDGIKWIEIAKDGKDGIDGKNAPQLKEILAQIPKPKDGLNGSPDTAFQIRDKLETLKGEDRLDSSAIKGLNDTIKLLQTTLNQKRVIYGPGKTKIVLIDLSSQLDGSTKLFFLGTHYGIVSVQGSSAPFGAFRETVDYTESGQKIQFTANIDATTALAAGQSLIVKVLR